MLRQVFDSRMARRHSCDVLRLAFANYAGNVLCNEFDNGEDTTMTDWGIRAQED